MRSMKMLVTLAATALVAIGVFGAGSASATGPYTALCTKMASPQACDPSTVLPKGSTIKTSLNTSGGKSRFRIYEAGTQANFVECDNHELTLTTTAKYSHPFLPAEFQSNVPAGECRFGGNKTNTCTSVALSNHTVELWEVQEGRGYATIGSWNDPLTLSVTCKYLGGTWSLSCQYKVPGAVELPLEVSNYGFIHSPVSVSSSSCGLSGYTHLEIMTYKNAEKRIGLWFP